MTEQTPEGSQDLGNPDVSGFQPDPNAPASEDGERDLGTDPTEGIEDNDSGRGVDDGDATGAEETGVEADGTEEEDVPQVAAAEDGGSIVDNPDITDLTDNEDGETWDDVKSDYQVAPEGASEEPLG
ncbi:MAG: hypothetical protein LWW86_12450 [Micrococcales bacterium]|nr:hypothetical protein [Micrococcales bacterium]